MKAGIIATGSYLPKRIITNQDIVDMGVDTSDSWIQEKIGIRERRAAAENEETHDLATKAVNNLLENAKIDVAKIDLIICLSSSSSYFCPATACLVQKEVGAFNAAAFDMNSVCASPVLGIMTAQKYIEDGTYSNVIVVCAEAPTKNMVWTDRTTSVFFGDGAAAILMAPVKKESILANYFKSDGTRSNALVSYVDNHRIDMDGKAIYEFAVQAFPESVKAVAIKAGINVGDIDWIISHQANMNIILNSMKQLGLPMSKTHITIQKAGNTVGASTYLTLDSALKHGKIKSGQIVVVVAFGGGLSWGANLIKWV